MIADAHCDYLSQAVLGLQGLSGEHISEQFLKEGGVRLLGMAAFCGREAEQRLSFAYAKSQIDCFYTLSKPLKEKLFLLQNTGTLAFLMLEGMDYIRSEADFYLLPVQNITSCGFLWNHANALGGSAYEDNGLTSLGSALSRFCEREEIAIDLSHTGQSTFFSLAEQAGRVWVSHANYAGAHNHPRNLTKEQIKLLIQRKSFMGLTFYRDFIGGAGGLEAYWQHISQILDLGGENLVGIGSDFEGCKDILYPLRSAKDLPVMVNFLASKLPAKLLQKLLWKNLADFMRIKL